VTTPADDNLAEASGDEIDGPQFGFVAL